MLRPDPASAPGIVLQVGDIAGVAEQVAAALDTVDRWTSAAVEVATVRRQSRIARLADLPLRAIATRRAVRRELTSTATSIVHLHWARYAPFLDTRQLPLVVHVHGTDVRGRSSTLTGSIVLRSLRKAAAVIVATPDLVEWTVPSAVYIPNAIDLDLFTPAQATEHDRSDRRPTVHLFARLDPVKGGRRLVEIAEELRRRAPDVRVVAFGGGPFDDAARSAGVEVLRPVDRSGVAAALRTADVVIGQQMIPMLGLSELEAMACAKPVIAPVSVGAYDVAPPVVVADGVAVTVERCLDLLDRPSERAEIGAAGRAYVGTHHSHAVVGARLATLYDRVAGAS